LHHALTFDLEDWHHLFYRHLTGGSVVEYGNVEVDTLRILDWLDESSIHATFFVVGAVARRFPRLIQETAHRGHEIGCHTYSHKSVHLMEARDFTADIARAHALLEDITGQPVIGFRAPAFSVGTLENETFFLSLVEEGFHYDSSVFPIAGSRYGIPESPQGPFTVRTKSGSIVEYPLATWSFRNIRVPIAGGSYFRFLPCALLAHALKDLENSGRIAVFYFHPYEFHKGVLRLPRLSWHHRLNVSYVKYIILHNMFTGTLSKRLQYLVSMCRFLPLGTIHENETIQQ